MNTRTRSPGDIRAICRALFGIDGIGNGPNDVLYETGPWKVSVAVDGDKAGAWKDYRHEANRGNKIESLVKLVKPFLSADAALKQGKTTKAPNGATPPPKQSKGPELAAIVAGAYDDDGRIAKYLQARGLPFPPEANLMLCKANGHIYMVAFAIDDAGTPHKAQLLQLDAEGAPRLRDTGKKARFFATGGTHGAGVAFWLPLEGASEVAVVEGVEDSIALRAAGYTGHVAAVFGISNFDKVALAGMQVLLVPDSDVQVAELERAIGKLYTAGVSAVRVASLMLGQDPASMVQARKNAELLEALTNAPQMPKGASNADGVAYIEAVTAASVKAEPIEWLWQWRLPVGKLTMLASVAGISKSMLSCEIAAAITSRNTWPVEGGDIPRGNVLMINTEDDIADTVIPRLMAAGADLGRVVFPRLRYEGKEHAGLLHLGHIELLDNFIGSYPPDTFKLMVLDPISALLNGADSHKQADVTSVLAPLAEVAARRRIAVLFIHHNNKGSGTDPLNKVMGSVGFVSTVRMAHTLSRDPEDESLCIFTPAKANIAPHGMCGLSYRVEQHTVMTEEDVPISTACIRWEGIDERTAREINEQAAEAGREKKDDGQLARAEAFLLDALKAGPVMVKALKDSAVNGNGISWPTIERAKHRLGTIHAEKVKDGWQWKNTGQGQQGQGQDQDQQDHQDHQDHHPSGVSEVDGLDPNATKTTHTSQDHQTTAPMMGDGLDGVDGLATDGADNTPPEPQGHQTTTPLMGDGVDGLDFGKAPKAIKDITHQVSANMMALNTEPEFGVKVRTKKAGKFVPRTIGAEATEQAPQTTHIPPGDFTGIGDDLPWHVDAPPSIPATAMPVKPTAAEIMAGLFPQKGAA